MDPNLLQQIAKSLGILLALHSDLQMKIAAWIGHEAARDERAADIGKSTARTGNDMSGYAGDKSSPTVEDTQQNQGLIQVWLIRQGDEVVSNLMQDRFADGELRLSLRIRCVSVIIVRATAPVSVATVKRYRPEPVSESVPLTRVRAASVDKSQYSHSGSQRASSSRTSAVNDMQAYAFVLARDRSRWEMLT